MCQTLYLRHTGFKTRDYWDGTIERRKGDTQSTWSCCSEDIILEQLGVTILREFACKGNQHRGKRSWEDAWRDRTTTKVCLWKLRFQELNRMVGHVEVLMNHGEDTSWNTQDILHMAQKDHTLVVELSSLWGIGYSGCTPTNLENLSQETQGGPCMSLLLDKIKINIFKWGQWNPDAQ